MVDLCQTIFVTTSPSYAVVLAFLKALLTYEKKILVWAAVRRYADVAHTVVAAVPDVDPNWDALLTVQHKILCQMPFEKRTYPLWTEPISPLIFPNPTESKSVNEDPGKYHECILQAFCQHTDRPS